VKLVIVAVRQLMAAKTGAYDVQIKCVRRLGVGCW